MGVSGTGKTSLGEILQKDLRLPFYDGDDFHSKENINKMKKGKSLDDLDRQNWLRDLSNFLRKWEKRRCNFSMFSLKRIIQKDINI